MSVVLADSEKGLGKLTQKEIEQYRSVAFKRFYLRPTYMLGQIYRNLLRNDYGLLFHGMKFFYMLKGKINT